MKPLLAPVLALSFIGASASAGEPNALHLEAVLDAVARRAPSILVQQEAVRVATERIGVEGAWEDPVLSVMGTGLPFPGNMVTDFTMIDYRFMQSLSPLWGRRGLAKEAAAAQAEQQQETLRRRSWDARAQAVMAFFDIWMNDEMQKVMKNQIATMERMRDSARARYTAGMMMAHHDYLRSDAEIATMQAELTSLTERRAAVVAMLNVLRGEDARTAIDSAALPERQPIPPLETILVSAGQRPEIVASRAMRHEMGARRTLAEREYLPMVMVGFTFEQQFQMPHTFGAEVSFSVPLWFFDRQKNMVAMADAMVRQSDRDVEAMSTMTAAEVQDAWSRARAADRKLTALETMALPRLTETVKSAESAYVSGSNDFLSYLESTLALRNLEKQRLGVLVDRETARFELSRLIGRDLPEKGSP